MLELINVTKEYKGCRVVDGVSFRVASGDILGMIGSNGAGKSTCISMIATLIKPDSGQILFRGQDIAVKPHVIREQLGYVPQDITLYESLSGLDNLKFWGGAYHIAGDALTREIERVAAIIGFDSSMLKKKVSEYSGGMKRRLNIGVALLHKPQLVIMDEPTTGIDLQSGSQILSSIKALGRMGTAVIYVGHYMEEVEQLCSHICIMDSGKCRLFGRLEEMLCRDGARCSLKQLYETCRQGPDRGRDIL